MEEFIVIVEFKGYEDESIVNLIFKLCDDNHAPPAPQRISLVEKQSLNGSARVVEEMLPEDKQ